MSASNAFETALLQHILQNAALANIGDTSGLQPSATAGSLYVSLHTADPGETGNQASSEASYTSYARVAVARSSSGWDVDGNTGSNVTAVVFPEATGGSSTVTHFGIGTASSGNGNLLLSGALDASRAVSAGIAPEFAIGELEITFD